MIDAAPLRGEEGTWGDLKEAPHVPPKQGEGSKLGLLPRFVGGDLGQEGSPWRSVPDIQ